MLAKYNATWKIAKSAFQLRPTAKNADPGMLSSMNLEIVTNIRSIIAI